MEKCKYCQAELEEGVTLCPACGKENAEEAAENAVISEEAVQAEAAAEEAGAEKEADFEEKEQEAEPAQEKTSEQEAEMKPGLQATPGKVAAAAAAVVVLLAVLIALVMAGMKDRTPEAVLSETTAASVETAAPVETVPATIPADGEAGTITEKGSYTVSDEEAIANADTVVATVGGRKLTNSQLQVYYWMEVQGFLNNYAAYASYFGLDYTQPLDMQTSMESENMTWQQYFLQSALYNWQQIQAMSIEAEKAGLEISAEEQEYLDGIPAILEQNAAMYNMTLDEFLLMNIGAGAGIDEFVGYQSDYHHGSAFYSAQLDSFVPTEADLEKYFEEHAEDYAVSGITKDSGELTDVRHILIVPEGGTADENGYMTYTEEEMAAARVVAEDVLKLWTEGEATEESFIALVQEYSADKGSAANGGLIGEIHEESSYVENFKSWSLAEDRKSGDTGIVESIYGWHIMYFVERAPRWVRAAENDWTSEQVNAMFASLEEKYPLEVSYDKIMLGYVALG